MITRSYWIPLAMILVTAHMQGQKTSMHRDAPLPNITTPQANAQVVPEAVSLQLALQLGAQLGSQSQAIEDMKDRIAQLEKAVKSLQETEIQVKVFGGILGLILTILLGMGVIKWKGRKRSGRMNFGSVRP